MIAHIIKKLLSIIPILLLVSIIVFFLMEILPGDVVSGMAGADVSQEYLDTMREHLGLNRSPMERYLDWMGNMLRGDFGVSLITSQPIINKIILRLPVTLELTFLAMLVSIIIALPIGILSAVRRNSAVDAFARVMAMFGVAVPPFWLGMLLTLLFSVILHWLPASGYIAFTEDPLGNLSRMLMPALSIGAAFAATITRQTRSSLLDVLDQDYILTARAKGLKNRIVILKHALRNSIIPVITVVAMQIGRLLGGAVISETVFAMPGIGRELVDGILTRDYPVVMALIMVIATIVVLINTLIDISYVVIDPHISHAKKG